MRDDMFHYDEHAAGLVFDYCRKRLALEPAPLDFSGDEQRLEAALSGLLGPHGNGPEQVLRLFADELAPAVISCDSPRFFSFIPAAPTRAAMLFDMVVSCSSMQGTSWLEAAGAIAAENQVISLLADLAGLPPHAGGVFVSGGSVANLSALAVARETARRDGRALHERPRVAVSDQAHSSVGNALRMMDMQELVVPSHHHRLTGEALAAALDSDAHASDVVAVVATAGTTNAGIVDELSGVAEVAGARGIWLHVDGAYGAAALFAPSARQRLAGIERADSFVVDPHKWLFAPFDCAGLIYREPALAKAVHTQHASYLDATHTGSEWNPSDYAYHLTRRARGLPLWFSLAVHGTDAYRAAIESVLETARRAAARIASADHVDLVLEPDLSIVLIRRPGWDASDYYRWSARLLEDQIAFITPTTWEGETVARLTFLNPRTTVEIVDEILATMR